MLKIAIAAIIMSLLARIDCSDFDELLAMVKSTQDDTGTSDGIMTPKDESLELPEIGLQQYSFE